MLLPTVSAGLMMIGAQAGATALPQATLDPTRPPLLVRTIDSEAATPPPPSTLPPSTPNPATPDDEVNDIVVTGASGPPPGDPLEQVNAMSFQAVQAVDKAVVEPVARAYNKGLPLPARKGLRNFFSNIQEPVVAAAYLLEFKPGKAFETMGRFAVNTTLGVAGLFDVAKRKPFNLPYRPNGLANVMGYYGIKPGPYMYLPVIGGTTLRDVIGDTFDKLVMPFVLGKPFNRPAYVIPSSILNQLGERAAFDEQIAKIRKDDDPYATYRTLYLQQRHAEIEALHGRHDPSIVPVYGRGLRLPGGKAPATAPTVPQPE